MKSTPALRRASLAFFTYWVVTFLVGIYVAEGTLHPARRAMPAHIETTVRQVAQRLESELQDVWITSKDGTLLRAWSVRPHTPNHQAVILLHGAGDNRLGMAGYAELLLKHNFSVLLPDSRAHGLSSGSLATYGLLERDDIRAWFDWLMETQHPQCVFGFGESMGAALILQALQSEPHFCAVAAESSFSSFREIAYDRMGQAFHTGPWLGRTVLWPVVEVGFLYSRWKYGTNFEQVSPESAVQATSVPVFLIHGENDRNIPMRHSRQLQSQNAGVVLWEVPNTDHCGAIATHRAEFELRLVDWFESHSLPRQLSILLTPAA